MTTHAAGKIHLNFFSTQSISSIEGTTTVDAFSSQGTGETAHNIESNSTTADDNDSDLLDEEELGHDSESEENSIVHSVSQEDSGLELSATSGHSSSEE